MSSLGKVFYKWLSSRYAEKVTKQSEAEFKYQIELENGESCNVKGFENPSNKIRTTQYTLANFVYLILWEHLQRVGNFFLYGIWICSWAIDYSQKNLLENNLLFLFPLMLQLLVLAIREIYYDQFRYRQDLQVNSRQVTVFREMRRYLSDPARLVQAAPVKIPTQMEESEKFINDKRLEQSVVPRRPSMVFRDFDKNAKPKAAPGANLQVSTHVRQRRIERVSIYESLSWDQVKVGDIVYLKKNETAPADLLILDSYDSKVQVNISNIEGKLDEVSRFSCPLTRSKNINTTLVQKNSRSRPSGFDYKKILTGFVKYSGSESEKMQKCCGYIKLKKDPKGDYFNDSNIIFREEQLKFQPYIYGLVLFAGNRTQCYQTLRYKSKQSFFLSKSRMFFVLSYVNCILMAILSWLLGEYQTNHDFNRHNKPKLTIDGAQYLVYLLSFATFMPTYFYLCIDLLFLINSIVRHRFYEESKTVTRGSLTDQQSAKKSRSELKNSEPMINYKQISKFSIADLAMTEYVCFSKTGTLTVGYSKIKAILIDDKFYKFAENLQDNDQWKQFKLNYLRLLVANANDYRIQEVEEKSGNEEDDRTPKARTRFQKLTNKMLLSNKFSFKKAKKTMTIQNMQQPVQTDDSQSIAKRISVFRQVRPENDFDGSKKSQNSQSNSGQHKQVQRSLPPNDSVDDGPENLRMEDLDDTHCKVTSEQRGNRPLPFFTKQHLNQNSGQGTPMSPEGTTNQVNHPLLMSNEHEDREHLIGNHVINIELDLQKRVSNMSPDMDNSRRLGSKQLIKDEEEPAMFNQEDFYVRLFQSHTKNQFQEAILAILLCHSSQSKFSQENDALINEYQQTMDQELMDFANQFDMRFVCVNEHQNRLIYIIEIKEELYEFQILAINHQSKRHPRISVLVDFPEKLLQSFGFQSEDTADGTQSADSTSSILFAREETNQLPHYIEIDKVYRDYQDKVFQRMHAAGLRTLVYSKTQLHESDKAAFLEKVQVLKSQYESDELIELYAKVEKDMNIIQVVGMQERMRADVPQTIQCLKDASIKLWLLSGDHQNKVIPASYKSGILDPQDHQVVLDDTNEAELKLIIRNYLQLMNNQLKSIASQSRPNVRKSNTEIYAASKTSGFEQQSEQRIVNKKSLHSSTTKSQQLNTNEIKPFNILLNGPAFQTISEDASILCHFCFILYFSTSLVAYNLSQSQKTQLIRIVKQQFPGNKRVMAVGTALNDLEMFTVADFGVMVERESLANLNQLKRMNSIQKRPSRIHNNSTKQNGLSNPLRKVFELRSWWDLPTAELVIRNVKDLLPLMLFESRLFAELIDDLLVFSFYRSLVLVYSLTLYNIYQNNPYLELYDYIELIFFQSLYLFIVQLANLLQKQNLAVGTNKELSIYSQQFKTNSKMFKKKKVLSFVFKINGNALFDAALQYFLLISQLPYLPDSWTGKTIDQYTIQQMAKVNILLIDMVKVTISGNFTTRNKFLIFCCYAAMFFLISSLVIYAEGQPSRILTIIITNFQFLWLVIGYILLSISMKTLVEDAFHSFFSNPLVLALKDYQKIQDIMARCYEKKTLAPWDRDIAQERRIKTVTKQIGILSGRLFNNRDDCDINIQQMVSGASNRISSEKINPLILNFRSDDTESKYRRLSKVVWLVFERRKQYFIFVMFEVMNLVIYSLMAQNTEVDNYMIFTIVVLGVELIVLWLVGSSKYKKHFFLINKFLVLIRVVNHMVGMLQTYALDVMPRDQLLIQQLYTFVVMFTRVSFPIITISAGVGFAVVFTILTANGGNFSVNVNENYVITNSIMINIMTLLVISMVTYRLTYMERMDFVLEKTLNQETQSINNVLSILLPKFIRDRINQQGVFDFQENQGDVSILFCDICNFDKIVAVEKEKIVNLLDDLFRAFDVLCVQNGMQKIETVGKTYMAAGGLKAVDINTRFQNINSVKRAINLSIEMTEFVKKFKFNEIGSINIKIGVHYGRVIAGVIGHHKPQFSLIGDTVNTTSRVCSTGVDGEITISQQAYEMVSMPELVFNKRVVNAKGKGYLTTYQVSKQGKRHQQKKGKRGVIPRATRNLQQQTSREESPSRNEIILNVAEKPPRRQFSHIEKFDVQQPVDLSKSSGLHQQEEYGDKVKDTAQFIEVLGSNKNILLNIQRRVKRVPTLVKSPQSFKNLSAQVKSLASGQGLEQSDSDLKLNQAKMVDGEESITDRHNQVYALEAKLRREVVIDPVDDNPEFEIEIDKIKIQLMNDEGDITNERGEMLELDPRKLYLGFNQHQETKATEFYQKTSAQAMISAKLILLATVVSFTIKTISLSFIKKRPDNFNIVLIVRGIGCVLVFLYMLAMTKKRIHRFYIESYIIMLYVILFFGSFLESLLMMDMQLQQIQSAEILLLMSLFFQFETVKIANRLFLMLLLFACQGLYLLIAFGQLDIVYYMLVWCFLQFALQYILFKSQINTFNNKISLELKKTQSSNLIMYLLPMHILGQFLQNSQRMVLVDQFEDATLLFADIAGFTEYSGSVEAEQVVVMLRNLFTEFDKACLIKNTYKLYTIGDCYVATGVVDASQRDPSREAKNIVELGFNMIETIQKVRKMIGFEGLDMRIGVHTGRLIGGILGTEIVRYDVYGSDVMIANKMESNGEKGRVQVSEETKNLIEQSYPNDFSFEYNKSIEFSSINRSTNGYFVMPLENSGFSDSEFGMKPKLYEASIKQVESNPNIGPRVYQVNMGDL